MSGNLFVTVQGKLANLLNMFQETLDASQLEAMHPSVYQQVRDNLAMGHLGLTAKLEQKHVNALLKNCHALQLYVGDGPAEGAAEEMGEERLALGMQPRGTPIDPAKGEAIRDALIEMLRVVPFGKLVRYINLFAALDTDCSLAMDMAELRQDMTKLQQ